MGTRIFSQPFSYQLWGCWKPGQQSLWNVLKDGEIGKMSRSRVSLWCQIREIKPLVLSSTAAKSNAVYSCQKIGVPLCLSQGIFKPPAARIWISCIGSLDLKPLLLLTTHSIKLHSELSRNENEMFRKSQAYDAGETITQSLPHACYSLCLPITLQEACCRAVLWDMGQCHRGREPLCPYLPS